MKKLFKVLGITIALTTVAAVIKAKDRKRSYSNYNSKSHVKIITNKDHASVTIQTKDFIYADVLTRD